LLNFIRGDEDVGPCPATCGAVKDWLNQKYHKFILRILRTIHEGVRSVVFAVKTQLDSLRGLILDLGETREKHATNPDQDQYVDALEEQVANGFKKFKINTKEVDIGSLAGEGAWEDKYNAIVNEINRYKELYMIGSGKRDVEGI
jgi:chromosomal replication initiation ATPase DnaA